MQYRLLRSLIQTKVVEKGCSCVVVVVVVVVMKDMPTLLQTSLLESCSQSKTSEYTSQAYKVPVSIAGR